MLQGTEPDWRPLERILPLELVETFMWMFEVETPTGQRIHVYKHIETRGYIHVDIHGQAFYFTEEARYRRIDLATLLEAVFRPWWEELDPSPEEVLAAWAAIDRARL